MKRTILLITTFLFIFTLGLFAQQQTSDGGYIIAGGSETYSNGDTDFILYKLAANGAKQWRRNCGGLLYDIAAMVQQTTDGGYIVAGITQSYGANSGGSCDMLVYKLDASGAKQWRKNYGGDECEHAWGVIQTADGGYLLIGETYTYTHGPGMNADFIAYKLDAAGSKQWRRNYGGDQSDWGLRCVQTADGGYALVGASRSYTNGQADVLVYKVDASGNKQWRKNYGGIDEDYGMFIRATSDGGLILSGFTNSYFHGAPRQGMTPFDMLVYKLDASGTKQWRKNYGGEDNDEGYDIRQTADGGYVLCGKSFSYTHGGNDMIVYKVNASGAKEWRKNYGGVLYDEAVYIALSSDGGYLLFGNTNSYTHGDMDFLVYRLDASGTKMWRKNFGGALEERINAWD